jgi:hydroxyethylthiazole kinase
MNTAGGTTPASPSLAPNDSAALGSRSTFVQAMASSLARLRADTPLVHNITNYVVMNTTANALLAIGASPAMVHAQDEVEEFVGISRALVVNIGTLSPAWVAAMQLAVRTAAERRIPWVLDPVGAGATTYRTRTAALLSRAAPAVIRGNASEIAALAGARGTTKGVDSVAQSDEVIHLARALADDTGAVVAITGRTDYVTDGTRIAAIDNGHPMMARVTGLGCTATALIGAFLGAGDGPFDAAIHGLTVLAVAGEIAAEGAGGPGTLQLRLLDILYTLDADTLATHSRVTLS